jgi:hypothetical protein
MATNGEIKQKHMKQRINLYNLLLNLFWSVLSFVPLCIFCFQWVEINFLFVFVGLSLLPAFFTRSALDKLQVSKRKKVFTKLGVPLFQHLTQNGSFVKYLIRKSYPGHRFLRPEKGSIEALLKQTYVFEKFHLMVMVFFCLTTIYALMKGFSGWAVVLTIINLVYNVYPILLQQYIRLKLAGYYKKVEVHKSRTSVRMNWC